MNDRDEKLNHEMDEVRRLIDGAPDQGFLLDDILSEYSVKKKPALAVELDIPATVPPQTDIAPEKGEPAAEEETAVEETPEEEPEKESEEKPEKATVDEIAAELAAEEEIVKISPPPLPLNNVLQIPRQKRTLSGLWQDLTQKGDQYAEGMFSEEDLLTDPDVKRREELIPGVDREQAAPAERRKRREDQPEPDVSPQELAARYGKHLGALHARLVLLLLLLLPALYLVLEPSLPLPAGYVLPLTFQYRVWISAGLLAAGMALAWDVSAAAVRRLMRGRLGMDTVLLLACFFTLTDALTVQFLFPREELPCCALNLLALYLALRGEYHRRRGLRLACRAAAASAEPYLVTLDAEKWNGRDTYTKHSGSPNGFGSRIQADDGAQRVFRVFCPVLLLGCTILPILSCIVHGRPDRLLWSLSATLTASCPVVAPLLFSRPFHRLSRRLIRSGGALAGWPGAASSRRGSGIILTDRDLFPPGTVSLNGIKVFGHWSAERVVAYAATLIRASGCGLDKLFHDLLRSQGAIYREAERLCCYEGGGLSADIRGDQVLVGSAAFMNLMDVELPQGLNVKNAVFCAIDGELAGIFALNYSLPDAVFPAVDALLREKIAPVLATRDFNVIPAMLRQRFKLAADRMDFPPVERRRELSDPEQGHSDALTAVLCREGILPFAESVVGARRLRSAVRFNAVLACLAAVIGLLLSVYLTGMGSVASISPFNLLLYLALWMIPAWFVMGWVDQF